MPLSQKHRQSVDVLASDPDSIPHLIPRVSRSTLLLPTIYNLNPHLSKEALEDGGGEAHPVVDFLHFVLISSQRKPVIGLHKGGRSAYEQCEWRYGSVPLPDWALKIV